MDHLFNNVNHTGLWTTLLPPMKWAVQVCANSPSLYIFFHTLAESLHSVSYKDSNQRRLINAVEWRLTRWIIWWEVGLSPTRVRFLPKFVRKLWTNQRKCNFKNKVTLRARLEIALAKKIVQLACPQLQIQIMVGPGPIFLVIFSNLRLFWAIFWMLQPQQHIGWCIG